MQETHIDFRPYDQKRQLATVAVLKCIKTCLFQRWLESLFQTPTPLLFQNFWIRVRLLLKFEKPTPVQTRATLIDPTVIYPHFYLKSDRTDCCYSLNRKVTPVRVRFFTNIWLRAWIRVRKKKARKTHKPAESTPDPVPSLVCSCRRDLVSPMAWILLLYLLSCLFFATKTTTRRSLAFRCFAFILCI